MTDSHEKLERTSVLFVVDDDEEVRQGLEQLARSVGLPVQSFSSAETFLEQYSETTPGCLVTDVRMPGMSGLDLQRHLMDKSIRIPVILVTAYAEVPMAVEAMQQGAIDFIQKPFSPQAMLKKVQHAIELDETIRDERQQSEQMKKRLDSLTARERQVFELLVDGESTKEIAAGLKISLTTVDFHRNHILEKMKVDNIVQLTKLFVASISASKASGG